MKELNLPNLEEDEAYVVFIDGSVTIGKYVGQIPGNGRLLISCGNIILSGSRYGSQWPDIFRMRNNVELAAMNDSPYEVIAHMAKNKNEIETLLDRGMTYMIYDNLSSSFYPKTPTSDYYQSYKPFNVERYIKDFNLAKMRLLRRVKKNAAEISREITRLKEQEATITSDITPDKPVVGERYVYQKLKKPQFLTGICNGYYSMLGDDGNRRAIHSRTELFQSLDKKDSFMLKKRIQRNIQSLNSTLEMYAKQIKSIVSAKPLPWLKSVQSVNIATANQ